MFGRLHRALTRMAAHPNLPARTIRLRLTALYGGLFLICGAGLLAITYALMWNVTSSSCYTGANGLSVCVSGSAANEPASPPPTQANGAPPDALTPQQVRALVNGQHAHEMHQLLIRSGIALAIMAAVSIALGWLVAGRVLRPLRRITEVTRDISATNLHERLALAGPDDELKELADTIDGLLARLEGAFDAQRRFVANASHELRTPLTLMRALLQMTLTDPDATLDSFRATCQDVLAEGERQERLIGALLVLARSERGLDHREPFDLAGVSDNVLLTLQAKADRLGVRVEASIQPAPTNGDARLAEQLVTNLVDNALRHNVTDGRVDVATGVRAGWAFVSVTNTGPVVPAQEVGRLFQPFQRLGADSTDHGDSLGLGLSIVAAIADAHTATITARAQPHGGLHIGVAFPTTAPRNGPRPTAAHHDVSEQAAPAATR